MLWGVGFGAGGQSRQAEGTEKVRARRLSLGLGVTYPLGERVMGGVEHKEMDWLKRRETEQRE